MTPAAVLHAAQHESLELLPAAVRQQLGCIVDRYFWDLVCKDPLPVDEPIPYRLTDFGRAALGAMA